MQPILNTERPIVFFDLETTGLDPHYDRIIEIACVRFEKEGELGIKHEFLVNPGREIPPEVTELTGIRQEDVMGKPDFSMIAPKIQEIFKGADIAGFNIARFDCKFLEVEMSNACVPIEMEGRKIVDVQTIFHRKNPRDLSAAAQLYLGREHTGAHRAMADVEATMEILCAQVKAHEDLPKTIDGLAEFCIDRDERYLDQERKLMWRGQDVVVNFGKHRGRPLRDLVEKDLGYIAWLMKPDRQFKRDFFEIIKNATDGIYPVRKKGEQNGEK